MSIAGMDVLSTGRDSPVNIDSSTFRFLSTTSTASADTLSPILTVIISPGTSSLEGISFSFPSRTTQTLGMSIHFKAFNALSALYSCTNPKVAMNTIMNEITIPFFVSPTEKDRIAAKIRIYTK